MDATVATREIYWNVGLGVVLPMYGFTILAVTICVYGFIQRFKVYRQGRALARLDRPWFRMLTALNNAFLQPRVLRVRAPGITHAFLFWGMVLLTLGTFLIMVQVDLTMPVFGIAFLKGDFYKIYSLALDAAGAVAILTLGGFAVRRFFLRPKGLEVVPGDYILHFLLMAILLTGFMIEGVRIASTELRTDPALAHFSPVGRLIAIGLSGAGMDTLAVSHRVLWWTHFVLVMALIAGLPFTKLRHVLTAPAGTLFGDLRVKGSIDTLNLEAEGVTAFGAGAVAELPWKDIFDADACMSCKRCQDRCPAWLTGKPLSPMRVVQQIGRVAFAKVPMDLIETVGPDALWACTTCRACQDVCPAEVEHVNKILEMRRNLVLMRGEFPGPEVVSAMQNLEVNGNPFGLAFATRGDWAAGLPVADLSAGGTADILYFAGCYASFDKRNQDVARSFVRICQAAGVSVGILGRTEKCCGEPLRKLGNEYLYQLTARENIERMKEAGVSRVVTTCPHCFNTLKVDYSDMGFDLGVEHAVVFVRRLVSEGRLRLDEAGFEATYHDSCYLGRYRDILEEPRDLLRSSGGKLTEMRASKNDSLCCGAGGGRILAEEKLGSRINLMRVKMAEETKAPTLVSSCPFCLTMFEDGIKSAGMAESMKARDLMEVVEERIAGR